MSELPKMVKKEKSERILTFDLLRGYFLCVILFDHLAYYPNGFDLFTGRDFLYVSTAEGFFVVSGIVLGIVRGHKLLHMSFWKGAKLLWKRALQLYVTSIVLTLIFTLVGQLFLHNPGLKYGIDDWDDWGPLIWNTITLNYTYGWADFLRLYALFIFLAPLALWLLRRGLWYVVFITSAILWALYPLLPNESVAQLFSWQFIFFSGFIIGFYWKAIVRKWRSLSIKTRKAIGWSLVATFIVTYITVFTLVFGHEIGGVVGASIDSAHHVIEQGFNKDRLPIPRIILGTIWFWALFFIVRRFEPWIIKHFGWLLLSFGANSLYVYTISAFVVFFMQLAVAPPGFGNLLINMAASLLALAIVYLAVRTKFLMKIIPR